MRIVNIYSDSVKKYNPLKASEYYERNKMYRIIFFPGISIENNLRIRGNIRKVLLNGEAAVRWLRVHSAHTWSGKYQVCPLFLVVSYHDLLLSLSYAVYNS